MITEDLPTLKIHKLTQEQYERELAAGNIDKNALYLTPSKEPEPGPPGVSVTHEWLGTVLKITSASGTSSADL